MNKCRKCGVENKIESYFCKACGERLVKNELTNEEATTIGVSDVIEKAEVNNIQEQSNKEVTNIIDKVKNKFKGNKKNVMIGVASLVILVLVGVVGASKFFTPEKRILAALYNLQKSEDGKGSVVFSLKGKNEEIPDIVKDISVEVFYDYNLKNQEYKSKGVLAISEEPLVEIISLINKEAIYIDTVDLYNKPFYINQDEEYALIIEDFNKVSKYLRDVKLKGIDKGLYIDALAKALEPNIEKADGKIRLELTPSALYDILASLSRVARDDKKLAGVLYEEVYGMQEKLKKENFKSEQFQDMQDSLEDLISREDFKENFADTIDDIYEEAKEESKYAKEYDSEVNIEVVFDISMLNKIKNIQFNVEVEGVKGTALLETGKTFKSKSYKKNSAVDLEDIMYTDEAEEIGMEIVQNVADKILNNNKIIKYLESSDVAYELEYYFGTTDIREILEEVLEESL